jgi:hypothetical protein
VTGDNSRIWWPECDAILRARWGTTSPGRVADEINSFLRIKFAGKKCYPMLGKYGRGVVYRAKALGIVSAERADEILKNLKHRNPIPASVREMIFARDGRACVVCGSSESIAIDHKKAVVNGGTNRVSNLQTLCKSCNSKKGGR